jgi:hypothetical protein
MRDFWEVVILLVYIDQVQSRLEGLGIDGIGYQAVAEQSNHPKPNWDRACPLS